MLDSIDVYGVEDEDGQVTAILDPYQHASPEAAYKAAQEKAKRTRARVIVWVFRFDGIKDPDSPLIVEGYVDGG